MIGVALKDNKKAGDYLNLGMGNVFVPLGRRTYKDSGRRLSRAPLI